MFLPQVNILKLGIETLKLKFVVGLKTQRVFYQRIVVLSDLTTITIIKG